MDWNGEEDYAIYMARTFLAPLIRSQPFRPAWRMRFNLLPRSTRSAIAEMLKKSDIDPHKALASPIKPFDPFTCECVDLTAPSSVRARKEASGSSPSAYSLVRSGVGASSALKQRKAKNTAARDGCNEQTAPPKNATAPKSVNHAAPREPTIEAAAAPSTSAERLAVDKIELDMKVFIAGQCQPQCHKCKCAESMVAMPCCLATIVGWFANGASHGAAIGFGPTAEEQKTLQIADEPWCMVRFDNTEIAAATPPVLFGLQNIYEFSACQQAPLPSREAIDMGIKRSLAIQDTKAPAQNAKPAAGARQTAQPAPSATAASGTADQHKTTTAGRSRKVNTADQLATGEAAIIDESGELAQSAVTVPRHFVGHDYGPLTPDNITLGLTVLVPRTNAVTELGPSPEPSTWGFAVIVGWSTKTETIGLADPPGPSRTYFKNAKPWCVLTFKDDEARRPRPFTMSGLFVSTSAEAAHNEREKEAAANRGEAPAPDGATGQTKGGAAAAAPESKRRKHEDPTTRETKTWVHPELAAFRSNVAAQFAVQKAKAATEARTARDASSEHGDGGDGDVHEAAGSTESAAPAEQPQELDAMKVEFDQFVADSNKADAEDAAAEPARKAEWAQFMSDSQKADATAAEAEKSLVEGVEAAHDAERDSARRDMPDCVNADYDDEGGFELFTQHAAEAGADLTSSEWAAPLAARWRIAHAKKHPDESLWHATLVLARGSQAKTRRTAAATAAAEIANEDSEEELRFSSDEDDEERTRRDERASADGRKLLDMQPLIVKLVLQHVGFVYEAQRDGRATIEQAYSDAMPMNVQTFATLKRVSANATGDITTAFTIELFKNIASTFEVDSDVFPDVQVPDRGADIQILTFKFPYEGLFDTAVECAKNEHWAPNAVSWPEPLPHVSSETLVFTWEQLFSAWDRLPERLVARTVLWPRVGEMGNPTPDLDHCVLIGAPQLLYGALSPDTICEVRFPLDTDFVGALGEWQPEYGTCTSSRQAHNAIKIVHNERRLRWAKCVQDLMRTGDMSLSAAKQQAGEEPKPWHKIKLEAFALASFAKFEQNAEMYDELMGTLSEGKYPVLTRSDAFWGTAMSDSGSFDREYPQFWKGENMYGTMLAYVRTSLASIAYNRGTKAEVLHLWSPAWIEPESWPAIPHRGPSRRLCKCSDDDWRCIAVRRQYNLNNPMTKESYDEFAVACEQSRVQGRACCEDAYHPEQMAAWCSFQAQLPHNRLCLCRRGVECLQVQRDLVVENDDDSLAPLEDIMLRLADLPLRRHCLVDYTTQQSAALDAFKPKPVIEIDLAATEDDGSELAALGNASPSGQFDDFDMDKVEELPPIPKKHMQLEQLRDDVSSNQAAHADSKRSAAQQLAAANSEGGAGAALSPLEQLNKANDELSDADDTWSDAEQGGEYACPCGADSFADCICETEVDQLEDVDTEDADSDDLEFSDGEEGVGYSCPCGADSKAECVAGKVCAARQATATAQEELKKLNEQLPADAQVSMETFLELKTPKQDNMFDGVTVNFEPEPKLYLSSGGKMYHCMTMPDTIEAAHPMLCNVSFPMCDQWKTVHVSRVQAFETALLGTKHGVPKTSLMNVTDIEPVGELPASEDLFEDLETKDDKNEASATLAAMLMDCWGTSIEDTYDAEQSVASELALMNKQDLIDRAESNGVTSQIMLAIQKEDVPRQALIIAIMAAERAHHHAAVAERAGAALFDEEEGDSMTSVAEPNAMFTAENGHWTAVTIHKDVRELHGEKISEYEYAISFPPAEGQTEVPLFSVIKASLARLNKSMLGTKHNINSPPRRKMRPGHAARRNKAALDVVRASAPRVEDLGDCD